VRGHEYIRDVVKAHLIATVPVRLAVIQAGLDDPVENLDNTTTTRTAKVSTRSMTCLTTRTAPNLSDLR
jgi:hypothetical protein